MGIKNFTVTAEGIKSAASREIYFFDTRHKNHTNTEEYINIHGSEKTTLNIIGLNETRKLKLAKSRKGGRPPKEGTEFVFALPNEHEFRPTAKQWRSMLIGVISDAVEHLKKSGSTVSMSDMSKITRAVVHRQAQNFHSHSAGDHMHVMVGNCTPSGAVLVINNRSFLKTLKHSWNNQVRKHLGKCHSQYEAKKSYEGLAKKRVPRWKINAARALDRAKKLESDAKDERIEHWFRDRPALQRLTREIIDTTENLRLSMASMDIKAIEAGLEALRGHESNGVGFISGLVNETSKKEAIQMLDTVTKARVSIERKIKRVAPTQKNR